MTMPRPIRTLIVDDEPLARDAVRLLLERDDEILIAGECADGAEAIQAIRGGEIDLVLLDVQMPEVTGLDVVRAIGPERMPTVIFATAYDRYAVDAFEAQALDYLLKPYDDRRFEQALARAKRNLGQSREAALAQRLAAALEHLEKSADRETAPRLSLKTSGRIVLVEPREIDWIEAADYCVRVHVGTAAHLVRDSIKAMEKRLDPDMFVRIHRSAIVNIDQIREVQPLFHGDFVVILKDGTEVRMSRSRRKALEARLGRII